MEPTAEQLVRDYLNRLSVAARTRLRSDDRRAFIARTREFLERRSAEADTDDAAAVRDALSALGEPVAAVENEYARLAAGRRKRAAARSGLWRPRADTPGEPGVSTGDTDAEPPPDAVPDPGPEPRRAPLGHMPRAAVDVSHLSGRELKGDIEKKVKVNRPLTSRWRPGAPAKPEKPVKQKPARSYGVPRPRVGGSQPGAGNGVVSPGRGTGPQQVGSPGAGSQAGGSEPVGSQAAGSAAADPQAAGSQPGGSRAGASGVVDLRPADAASGPRAAAGPASPTLTPPGGSSTSVLPGDWLSGPRPEGAEPGTTPGSVAPESPPPGPGSAGSVLPGLASPGSASAGPAAPEITSPGVGSPGVTSPGAGSPADTGADSPGSGPGRAGSAGRPAGGIRTSATRPGRVLTARLPRVQRPELSDVGRGLAARVVRFTRQHRLETAAVVLMVLCGLIYPIFSWVLGFSLWLLGAILAAASRQWSLWEKWTGLLGPVVLVIAGTSVGLALGGHHHTVAPYVHEVLADSRVMIKIAAVLGAVYLAWRAHRGPSYQIPPWNRSHRI